MTEDQYDEMPLRTVYKATINGKPVRVRKPDSGGIIDHDEPTKEYEYESIVLGSEIKN